MTRYEMRRFSQLGSMPTPKQRKAANSHNLEDTVFQILLKIHSLKVFFSMIKLVGHYFSANHLTFLNVLIVQLS